MDPHSAEVDDEPTTTALQWAVQPAGLEKLTPYGGPGQAELAERPELEAGDPLFFPGRNLDGLNRVGLTDDEGRDPDENTRKLFGLELARPQFLEPTCAASTRVVPY